MPPFVRTSITAPFKPLWSALNAATEFADHQRRLRGDSELAKRENRLDSIWFGAANDFKQHAYRKALELAAVN